MYHTATYGIVYDCSSVDVTQPFQLVAYVDADWGGRMDDSKSTTGWILSLAGVTIYAASKIQRRPALSTAEAETNGVESVFKEIEWTVGFLGEVKIKVALPVPVREDNQATIVLSQDPVCPSRNKYYRITQAYVRWVCSTGLAKLVYWESQNHPCDLLNKLCSKQRLLKHRNALMGVQEAGTIMMVRYKQCSRQKPLYLKKIGNRYASFSDHEQTLVASCFKCSFWLLWSKKGFRWKTCLESSRRCSGDDFKVFCESCGKEAVPVPKLDSWYCSACVRI